MSDAAAAPSADSKTVAAEPPADPAAQLQALKAKTAKWKTVVKAQLEEAAQKNERLREELATANKRADAAGAQVRLQLTAEFKERTSGKEDEIKRL